MHAVGLLTLAQARRERSLLSIWILSVTFFGFVVTTAISSQFAGEAERALIVTLAASNPAFLFLRGLPDGTSLGALMFFQAYSFSALLAGLMSAFLAVRNTRTDEELGRAELVGGTPVGRVAPLVATLIVGTAANALLAVCYAGGLVVAGLPIAGSAVAGGAVGSVGLFFLAIGAAVAQVFPSGRSANAAASAVVGLAYVLRGIGDALGTVEADLVHVTSAWPSLLSPIGWGQRSRPFSTADPAPLLIVGVVAVVLGLAVVLLHSRRDLGASFLPEPRSRIHAGWWGGSFLGLAWHLQRPTLTGWAIGAVALGTIAGTLGGMVADILTGNQSLMELITRIVPGFRASILDLFLTALLGVAGILASAAGVQAVLRLHSEESEGRAELLLAVPRSRALWLGASLLVAAVSAAVVTAVAGSTAALSLGLTGAAYGQTGILVPAALAHLPAALVFTAVAALAFAAFPRAAGALGWGWLATALVIGQFGELLGLPEWLQDLSPFRHSSAMPIEQFNQGGAIMLAAVAALGAALAAGIVGKRDLAS